MDVYKIIGGNRLKGTVKVSGAKNSAVALIPASILANSPVTIGGIPEISDAFTLKALLEEIGGEVVFQNGQMTIDPTNMTPIPLPNGNVKNFVPPITSWVQCLDGSKGRSLDFRADVSWDRAQSTSISKALKL